MTMETPATRRRFTLLDAMIVVGSAAPAFAVLRATDETGEWLGLLADLIKPELWRVQLDTFAYLVPLMLTPLAVSATLDVLALRLRKPRPGRRRLARQPGFAACLATALAGLVGAAFTLARMLVELLGVTANNGGVKPASTSWDDPFDWLDLFAHSAMPLGGFGVVVAWAGLALAGIGRPEPGWVDRMGRLVGLAWIALGLAEGYLLSLAGF